MIESKSPQLGVDGPDVTFAGLDGDADEIYKLIMWQANQSRSGQSEYLVYPNGISGVTLALGRQMRANVGGSALVNFSRGNGWQIGNQNSGSQYTSTGGRAVMYIHARSGKPRFMIHHLEELRGGPTLGSSDEAGTINTHECGVWPDSTTNLTSLVIHNRFNLPDNGSFQGEWSLYKVNI